MPFLVIYSFVTNVNAITVYIHICILILLPFIRHVNKMNKVNKWIVIILVSLTLSVSFLSIS